jgi:glutaminyl-tRNA synthetase
VASPQARDFIRDMVAEDVATNRFGRQIVTRFPPEPNGFPHIGHVKSICLNFGIASEFSGRCNLRFDDTNPETEDIRYVEAIKNDIEWLGFKWDAELYASDYFGRLYEFAELLVKKGSAYVDSQSGDEIRRNRGTVTVPGTNSPFRDRTAEENLDLLRRMRAGEFPDGAHVLRAKIDMAHPNMVMRDPVLLRIRHEKHYRQGDEWCLYPLYDFAHPLSDAIEGITHSLCTLEFKDNNDIYRWLVRECGFDRPPEQTEFSRLNLEYTVVSKRKLLRLVESGVVAGWDDPRMPTISGLRRRGATPEALRDFVTTAGVSRKPQTTELATLEHAIRNDLNMRVPRVMCVVRPLKVVLTNYPEGEVEQLDASYYPHDVPKTGSRPVPFSRELYIERDDFMEDPPKKFFRLAPGREVRLRYAYFITCQDVVKNEAGDIVELRCTYDPATRGGDAPDGRKVQGTIHWVSAPHSLDVTLRLYDKLFDDPAPDESERDILELVNRESLTVVGGARVEPSVGKDPAGSRYQFERTGYFMSDPIDSRPGALVFNRTVTLRDSWAKLQAKPSAPAKAGGVR